MTETPYEPSIRGLPVRMLIVLWLVGWTLRVPILAAPPLATRIGDDFGLGDVGIGALTMLPVIAVAVGAIPAALIIARFGLRAAIVGGLVAMSVASVARGGAPSTTVLFAMSLLMGFSVSVYQTALPAATRVWTPTHIALGNAVYLNGMMVGELSGAGLTLPLVLPLAGGDWGVALAIWAIPVLLIAALTAFARFPCSQEEAAQAAEGSVAAQRALPRWNDRRVWQYGLLAGGSIVSFFVINAYAGTILRSRDESHALEGLLLAYNATPLAASVVVLIKPKWIGNRTPIAVSAVVAAAGLAGFAFLDGWASWAAAVVAGFAATVEMILLLSLPATIASGKAVTQLSAGMTLIGFGFAFALPLVGGMMADRLDRAEMALLPSLVFAVGVFAALGRERRYPKYE